MLGLFLPTTASAVADLLHRRRSLPVTGSVVRLPHRGRPGRSYLLSILATAPSLPRPQLIVCPGCSSISALPP
jgi:hypothetical protein